MKAPVIAGQLIEQFGLTPVQVGTLFSLEVGAFSLATVPAYLWLRGMDLRTASYIFTVAVAVTATRKEWVFDSELFAPSATLAGRACSKLARSNTALAQPESISPKTWLSDPDSSQLGHTPT